MISFIVMYTKSKEFKYTINSINKNNKEEYEIIVIAPENTELSNLDTNMSLIYYKDNENLSKVINKSIKNAKYEICFLVKSGCYITIPAISSLKKGISDNSIGIILPKLNTFFDNQKHEFKNVLEDIIIKEAAKVSLEYHEKKDFTKDIDDNLIVFKKDVFNKLGGFDENISSLPVIYKDYLITNFQQGYNVMVALDALVYSKNICNRDDLDSSLAEALNKKLGFKVSYYSGIRSELIEFINENPYEDLNILEVGCASGYTLMSIKNKFPYASVHGLEIVENCKKIAPPCVDLIIGDCMEAIEKFEDESLDYIICPDVLEHLVDPWTFVSKCHKKLSQTGKLIASIPNISHISVISEILNGVFNYKDAGILDSTHLRFFTINTMIRLFNENGYNINQISGVQSGGPGEAELIKEILDLKIINKSWNQPLDLATQFNVIQYHLICTKAGE